MADNRLSQAILEIESGNKETAQGLLAVVLRQDPNNADAWRWMAIALDDPDKKRQCWKRALRLNPGDKQAAQALGISEQPSTASATTLHGTPAQFPAEVSVPSTALLQGAGRRMVRLHCPSCNGALELPDNLDVIHCMYCGTKIWVQQTETAYERQHLARYVELCKVAIEAENHEEAIRYCNSILEIDSKNIQAWIDKAICTFWLTTGANNRYDEAMGYLRQASRVSPGDTRIADAWEELNRLQALWYNHLGNESFKQAEETYRIYSRSYHTDLGNLIADQLSGYTESQAREHSSKYYIQAMEHYLQASTYAPADMNILENIAGTAKRARWISRTEAVSDRLRTLKLLDAKHRAEAFLSQLRKELADAQTALAKLKREKGVLANVKIRDVEKKVKRIQTEIAQQEKAAAYEAPRLQCNL